MSTIYDRMIGDSSLDIPRLTPRTIGVATIDGSDGPVLGLSYQADFRCEEEMGCSKLRDAFMQAAPTKSLQHKANKQAYNPLPVTAENQQAQLVFSDDRVIVFATSNYTSNVDWQIDQARRYFSNASAEDAGTAPAWFHFGDLLIIPLDRDRKVAAIARELVDAAEAGALCAGSIGVNVFGQGLFLFDERDLSKVDAKAAIQATKTHAKRMKELEPVAEIVKLGPMKNEFSAYYFLGNPRLDADGDVVYWLNGSPVRFANGRSTQPHGWYTLEDLVSERYILSAAERADRSFCEFDDAGSFRKVKLSEYEARVLLKERGLKTAVDGLDS